MGIRLDPIRGLIVDDQLSQGSKYTTQAAVRYLDAAWRDRAETPRIGSRESRRANTSFHNVTVHDARPRLAAGQIDLDRSGFTLTQHRTSVTDFRNADAVAESYYSEMKELVCRVTGASRALVRSHLVRTEKRVDFNDGYARFVHCDYNVARLGEMAHELLARDGVMPQENWTYAWYNTWQPFDHQVQNNPLAFIGWGSLPLPDVIDYFYTGHNQDSLVAAPVLQSGPSMVVFSADGNHRDSDRQAARFQARPGRLLPAYVVRYARRGARFAAPAKLRNPPARGVRECRVNRCATIPPPRSRRSTISWRR